MSWLAALLLRVGELGPWGPVLFALLYILFAVTMAPAFVLTVAAGALFGVWRGSVLVFVSATLGATAAVDFLYKPCRDDELLRALETALAKSAKERT